MLSALSNHPDLSRWLLALIGAAVISGIARHLRSLSPGGMIAATLLGTALVGAGGWWAGALLVTFFMTASLLSRPGKESTTVAPARGSQRDAVQVLANGGVALVCALGYLATDQPVWLVALAGSFAAANADTWGTEVGRSSPTRPRLVTTGKPVPAGTSGAVSRRGLVGAVGGAALIGIIAAIGVTTGAFTGPWRWTAMFAAITIAGVSGSLADSLLGATVQEQRWCDTCKTRTEQRIHHCGTPTRHTDGASWITNDTVNGLCTLAGAIAAAGIVTLLS